MAILKYRRQTLIRPADFHPRAFLRIRSMRRRRLPVPRQNAYICHRFNSNPMNGFAQHLLTSLRLNFRNPQALVFGYVVPLFFLIAFGALFHNNKDPLRDQLGQVLTISVLGGACFGLPITFVSERERGVWPRYR